MAKQNPNITYQCFFQKNTWKVGAVNGLSFIQNPKTQGTNIILVKKEKTILNFKDKNFLTLS